MSKTTNNIKSTVGNSLGLVVPIDVEALCIGQDPGAGHTFQSAPFNFSLLANAPYLSQTAAAGGGTNMQQGVHLHWALPDSLAKGQQINGQVIFPSVPDRWLVTRIFCDPDTNAAPALTSWVIESNYFSNDNPNTDGRSAVTVPYSGTDWKTQPWRNIGKVSTLQDWMAENPLMGAGPAETYFSTLTAMGYGQTDFAANYHSCQNVFGFNDLGSDLNKLGTAGHDKYVSYHIIGWFSDPTQDPICAIPALLPAATYNQLVIAITDPTELAFFKASFQINDYGLVNNIPVNAGTQLFTILQKGGYPIQVTIPLSISPSDFSTILANLDAADQQFLKTYYQPEYVPVSNMSPADMLKLYGIMAVAGFDFLGQLLTKAEWSLSAGTADPAISPSYTMYSGCITNIVYNSQTNYFVNPIPGNFSVAVGNTPGEALSALIANTTQTDPAQIAEVEEILNALQAGILNKVTNEDMLADWEELQASLHKNSFGSQRGGYLWQVQQVGAGNGQDGEVTLPEPIAKALNEFNINQQLYNDYYNELLSIKTQIFSDWYRFMLIQYPGQSGDPSHGTIDTGDLYYYVTQKIVVMNALNDKITALVQTLDQQRTSLATLLGSTYYLSQVTAPRFWQPNDPVLLFQGDGIDPTDRFGNDGRFMYNDTLVCRLSTQLITAVTIPAQAFGNTASLTLNASNFNFVPDTGTLPVANALNQVLLDAALINEDVLAAELRVAGVTASLPTLAAQVASAVQAFLLPAVPQQITVADYNHILSIINSADAAFLNKNYALQGQEYVLTNPGSLTDDDTLRIQYLVISTSYSTTSALLNYTGLAFSPAGIHSWKENPWLPYSLQWTVYFYPLDQLTNGVDSGYPSDLITSNFTFGNTDLVYTGPSKNLNTGSLVSYSNSIILTPHASINLQNQLSVFINTYPDDPIKSELKTILGLLGDTPVLSQALSGFNDSLLMQTKEMQLPVGDPQPGNFYNFSNIDVPNAVGDQRTQMPAWDNSYNPIRAGLMQIAAVTLVDVFGQNVSMNPQAKVYTPFSMQQTVLQPNTCIYLPPRITQPSRLQFRWLSANDDEVEMNSHPASSPICGWVLANHLDDSLWIYDQGGTPYGSLILNWDQSAILWQSVPGSPYFGYNIQQFFSAVTANVHLQNFVMGLYGDGGAASATYLGAFMAACDEASVTIQPSNFQQTQSNAVFVGQPMALVRASFDLELLGEPSYNQSFADLTTEVNGWDNQQYIAGEEYNFTQVNFPVKIGNIVQTEDGLVGYFKDENYKTFYCPSVKESGNGVEIPGPTNLLVNCASSQTPIVISMLVDPRGKIHATTGILPVKAIDIPPDQYLDALQKLQLCFLTTPVLTPPAFALPIPAQSGGTWSWIENDGSQWQELTEIVPVTIDAVMNYMPQRLTEGWLNLSNGVLTGNSFSIINNQAQTAVLYITNNPAINAMTFTYTNNTGSVLSFTGGPPINNPGMQGGSSFVFNFGSILPDAVLAGLTVSGNGWTAAYFAATALAPAMWAIAPDANLQMQPGAAVSFSINGITCAAGTKAGNFQVAYYGLPSFPDSLAPVLLPVAVQNPPSPKP